MKFSYSAEIGEVSGTSDLIILRRPVIDVILVGTRGELGFSGLVDTGADFTIFPKTAADLLGIYFTATFDGLDCSLTLEPNPELPALDS